MHKIVSYIILVLMIASILVPVGIGYASEAIQPALPVAEGRPLISDSGTWSIAPCKYVYPNWVSKARVGTTISNLSSEDAKFDLGDGNTVIIKSNSSIEHKYVVDLDGSTVRVRIIKLSEGSGLVLQEGLILKIEPYEKGGDVR